MSLCSRKYRQPTKAREPQSPRKKPLTAWRKRIRHLPTSRGNFHRLEFSPGIRIPRIFAFTISAMQHYLMEESPFSHFFTADTRSAWLWLVVRVWLGGQWVESRGGKFQNPVWWGSDAGGAISGFAQGALAKTGGAHPDGQGG